MYVEFVIFIIFSRNKRNGAVLVRSSQPEMGFFGWRNEDDENLLNAIPQACALNSGSAKTGNGAEGRKLFQPYSSCEEEAFLKHYSIFVHNKLKKDYGKFHILK